MSHMCEFRGLRGRGEGHNGLWGNGRLMLSIGLVFREIRILRKVRDFCYFYCDRCVDYSLNMLYIMFLVLVIFFSTAGKNKPRDENKKPSFILGPSALVANIAVQDREVSYGGRVSTEVDFFNPAEVLIFS
jgi:hypothetical protein